MTSVTARVGFVSLKISFVHTCITLMLLSTPSSLAQSSAQSSGQGGRFPVQAAQLERLYTLIQTRYVYPDRLEGKQIKAGLNLAPYAPKLSPALEAQTLKGKSWTEVRDFYAGRIRAARDEKDADAALEDMVEWLADNHSTYLTPARANAVKARFGGNIPCINYSGQTRSGQTNLSRSRALETRLERGVGIVVLPDILGFDRTANMRSALLELRGQGAKAFVLDVRGNPGGQLVDMVGLGGLFSRGVLWRLNLRGLLFPIPLPAVGAAEFKEPLAFVIDRDVNSAAEGLSGGLQSVGRARVFGQTSAGNVEAVYPYCLPDGAIAFVASGQLAPWGGSSWEGKGVVPDGTGGLEGAIGWARGQIKPGQVKK